MSRLSIVSRHCGSQIGRWLVAINLKLHDHYHTLSLSLSLCEQDLIGSHEPCALQLVQPGVCQCDEQGSKIYVTSPRVTNAERIPSSPLPTLHTNERLSVRATRSKNDH